MDSTFPYYSYKTFLIATKPSQNTLTSSNLILQLLLGDTNGNTCFYLVYRVCGGIELNGIMGERFP
jgi:hypothetical protein